MLHNRSFFIEKFCFLVNIDFMSRIFGFIKKQMVLCIAWILAIVSSVIVRPSISNLRECIDVRSLAILFSLMAVVQCFALNGMFQKISSRIVGLVHKKWMLILSLVVICFVFSMFITNDVALITFVPLTIMILNTAGFAEDMILTIVLETIAANTGSMLTPIGNPQNLYLYNLMHAGVGEFILIMLPYSLASLVLLCLSIFFVHDKKASIDNVSSESKADGIVINRAKLVVFSVLAVLCLLTVFNAVPFYVTLGIVAVVVFIVERRALKTVDYFLLLTFIGFFIFTGNLARFDEIKALLESLVTKREVLCGVVSSQLISNVPAALLLSNFTDNIRDLVIGVNLGGMGTLIASMASLISYKLYAATADSKSGRYMMCFTLFNVVYLVLLYGLYIILG